MDYIVDSKKPNHGTKIMYIIYMTKGFIHSTRSFIHCFIFIWEFRPPLYRHCVFDYLINCTLQFFCILYNEPFATIKNCVWAFPSSLEVLKQVQHHVICALCTPLLLGDQMLLPWQVRNNGLTFIIPCLHEIGLKSSEKGATCFSMWDNSHNFKCTNRLGSQQRMFQCPKNPTSCPTATYAINQPWLSYLCITSYVNGKM
jgi:hypothetical protein